MQLRQLLHFRDIASCGSLTRAACLLNVAQPTLSRDIRLLELELATQLFYRHGRGLTLTPQGMAFLDAVGPHLGGIERARRDLIERSANPRGTVRLGWTGTISVPVGAQIITHFKEAFPNVELLTLGGSSSQVMEWTSDGRIDLGVMNSDRPARGAQQEHLMSAELFHISRAPPEGDDESQTIHFRVAASYPLILHGRQHAMRRAIDIEAKRNAIELKVIAQIDQLIAIKELICQGHGTTILPLALLGDARHDRRLCTRRIVDPAITLYFCILYPCAPRNYLVGELAKIVHLETHRAIEKNLLDGSY